LFKMLMIERHRNNDGFVVVKRHESS